MLTLQNCLHEDSKNRQWLHTLHAEKISRSAGYLKRHLWCQVGAAMTFLLPAGASEAQTQAFPQQQGSSAASEIASTLVC